MVELKHVGVFSAAKFCAVYGFFAGLIMGVFQLIAFMALSSLLGSFGFRSSMTGDPLGVGVGLIIGGMIGGAIFGFIAGAFSALFYNIIASLVGGINLTFAKVDAPGALPAQTRRQTVATTTGAAVSASTSAGGAQPRVSGVATAVNPELLSYVKGELAAGRVKDEVVADLVNAGWSQDDIHAALNAAVLG